MQRKGDRMPEEHKKWQFLAVADPKHASQSLIRCAASRLLPISLRHRHVHGFVGLTTLHASIPCPPRPAPRWRPIGGRGIAPGLHR
ncbi:unnamed protein product, partial [Mesorhabditis spiculigera]